MGVKRKATEYLNDSKTKRTKEVRLLDLYDRITIESDGNCLFRAIQYFLTGKEDDHFLLRQEICDFMATNKYEYDDLFEPTSSIKTFSQYLIEMRKTSIWGDHLEIVAASKLKGFNFTIYASESLIITNHHINDPKYSMLYLEYFNGNHYNILIQKASSNLFTKVNTIPNFSDKKSNQSKIQIKLKNTSKRDITKLKDLKSEKKSNEMKNKSKFPIPIKETQEIVTSSERNLYPKAKGNHEAYNEVYLYLRYKKRPEDLLKIALLKIGNLISENVIS